MLKLICRVVGLFAGDRRHAKSPRNAALRLETLEERAVPTAYTWTNGDGNGEWADTNNWSGGNPAMLQFFPNSGADTANLGSETGTITYESWTDPATNTVYLVSGSVGYLTAPNTYSGTLQLKNNLQITESLTWASGTIDFNNAYTLGLSGVSASTWTGGTIGNFDAGGTFKIEDSATLQISSSVVTLGVPTIINASVTVQTEVDMPNTTVTVIVDGGSLEFKTGGSEDYPYNFGPGTANGNDYLKVHTGFVTFDGGSYWKVTLGVWNNNGEVNVLGGASVSIPNSASVTSPYSYYQSGSASYTKLGTSGGSGSATVDCGTPGFGMDSGSLYTYSTSQQEIKGPTKFNGGSVDIGEDLEDGNFGWLYVNGNLTISGSTTVYVAVSLASEDNFSKLTVSNTFTVSGGTVDVTTVGTGDADQWEVFAVDTGGTFSGQFTYVSTGFTLFSDATGDDVAIAG